MTEPEDKPSARPTQKVKGEEIQIGLLNKLIESVRDMRIDLQSMRDDQRNTQEELRLFKAETEQKFGKVDARASSNSMRAKGASEVDLSHEAKLAVALAGLAEEKQRREKLEAEMVTKAEFAMATANQTSAIVEGVKEAAKNPTVRKIGWAFAGLVFLAINTLTTYLTSKGH